MGEGGPGDAVEVQEVTRSRGCLSLQVGSGLGNLQALPSCTTGPLLNPQQDLSPLCLPHVPILPSCIASHLSHTGTTPSSRSSAQAGVCWLPGERAGGSSSRQGWGEAASLSV